MQTTQHGDVTRKDRKKKRSTVKKVVIVLVWIAVIAAIAFLVLFLASKIGQFDSIGSMIEYIRTQM